MGVSTRYFVDLKAIGREGGRSIDTAPGCLAKDGSYLLIESPGFRRERLDARATGYGYRTMTCVTKIGLG